MFVFCVASSVVHHADLCFLSFLVLWILVALMKAVYIISVKVVISCSSSSIDGGKGCVSGAVRLIIFLNLSQLVFLGLCLGMIASVSEVTWNFMYLWSDGVSSSDACQFFFVCYFVRGVRNID